MLVLAVLNIASFICAAEASDIIRTGRKIQLDGFLIDWMEKERHAWGGSGGWYWDALNTPEGVAGYFSNAAVRCSAWTFSLAAVFGVSRQRVIAVTDTGGGATRDFTCVIYDHHDSAAAVTIEWLLPWDSVGVDSSGDYAVHAAGVSVCGDTLPSLMLMGSAGKRRGRGAEAPGILFWGACAAACAAAAAAGLRKIRKRYCQKRTCRTGSLRR
ncbi:MAG: hypothetical protein JW699_03540 [Chitinispirillaceae bacterium]|nr:hypothetical protein [Chitinispirillaceae bacterium]